MQNPPETPRQPAPQEHAQRVDPNRGRVPAQREPEIHLLDRLAVFYRYRRIALAIFLLTSAVLITQSYSRVRVYQAQARLLIEDERSTAIPGLTMTENFYWEDPEPYRQTQYRILKGRELTRRVVRRLDLAAYPEFSGSGTSQSVFGALSDAASAAFRHEADADATPPESEESIKEAGLVDGFIARVIVEPVVGSKLVDVYFRSEDPTLSALATNALVDEYLAQNLEAKTDGVTSLLEWLDQELIIQQQKVEASERSLAEYRDRENAMSLDQGNNIVATQLSALNEALLRAQATRIERETTYNQLEESSASGRLDAIPAIAQNPQVQTSKAQLAGLQRQKAELAQRYGDRHPEILNVTASIADTERQLELDVSRAVQSVRNEYERAAQEERTIHQNLEAAKADVKDLNRKSVSYNVLEREAQSNRTVYETLLQRANELRVSTNSRTNNIRVIDRAEIPKAPITPAGSRAWLTSMLVGLLAAVAVAYGLDYLNDTVKTPEDIARYLNLPFFGLVPTVSGGKDPLLASPDPPHDFSEAFRSLRTSITSHYPVGTTNIMAVTSAQPLEGKTTTACNIAMALSFGGARVLLVDADMRRPGLHRLLKMPNGVGLSQVLKGEARLRDAIQQTSDPNLLIVTAGDTPPNPSELLASDRMKALLTNLTEGPFDWVIVDTPPVLAVTDAVIMVPAVSGVTFVIGAEMTRRRNAQRALERVLSNQPKVIGAVLNLVDYDRNKYYYSRHHGHGYQGYYATAAV